MKNYDMNFKMSAFNILKTKIEVNNDKLAQEKVVKLIKWKNTSHRTAICKHAF